MTERLSDRLSGAGPRAGYAELQAMSNFTFLDGASHPDELVIAARALGLSALAITDRNSMAGLVRGHVAAREQGLRFLPGVRLDLVDGVSLLAWPRSRAGYGALTRLVSTGQRRVGKGGCRLGLDDLYGAHADAVFALVAPPGLPAMAALTACAAAIRHHLDRPLYLAAAHAHDGRDRRRLAMLDRVATDAGTPLLATGDVRYHSPARRPLADVLTCIRLGHTLATAGTRLDRHGERHLKSAAEMARLFADVPDAVARTLDVAEACTFSLDQLRYDYPDEPVPEGESAQSHLEALTWDGARHRFPAGVPAAVARTIARELALIGELDYAPYFLTVHDIVRFARSRGILCQGRGSAANSVVCYCLAITSVNPVEVDLLFERFISAARNEPPDIDVDFEHERREEVIQYIYARYGRERAALAATVIRYRPRSAVRDVGKVFGLGEDVTAALAGTVWGSWGAGVEPARVREAGLDPDEPTIARTLALSEQLLGFPRHLSQHVGGFVLTRSRLDEIVPVGNAAMADRTVIEWDKDDLDALGLLKIDVLALGMLTCIRKAFDLMRAHGRADLSLSAVPREDRAVYAMLARADSLGVFQVESRAQMAMLPRLRPRTFYDLVIEVAIVRPGPIQGDMVHPYLRRRNGEEAVVYPSPDPAHGPADELESVLGKTLGVPLFQEQAMRIAMVAAGFSGAEADRLRRAMATFRKVGTIAEFQHKMVPGMAARGYDPAFAERCFKQIEGFGEYGFPESHAASFALLVYVSAWLKCHEPAVFCASLLNSQPMGFYAPAQIVRDARDHGVAVRPVDALASHWDCTLEADPRSRGGLAVRLGLRLVKGLDRAAAARLVVEREGLVAAPGAGPLRRGGSAQTAAQTARTARAARAGGLGDAAALIAALHRRGVARPALETLAGADAFAGLGLDRRRALWAVRGLPEARPLPLFAAADMADSGVETGAADAGSTLPALSPGEQVVEDYQALHLSLKGHPVSFLRGFLAEEGASRARDLVRLGDGARVVVAGLVLVRQRPGSAKGVVFLTLEDESGVANAVIWPKVLEAQRPAVMGARLALVAGRVQRQGDVIHVVADRVEDRSGWLLLLCEAADALAAPLARGDEAGTDTAHTDDISAGASRAATSVASGTVAGARTRPGHRPRSRQPKPPPDATWQRRLLARLHDRLPPPRAVHACDVRDLVPRSRDFH